MLTDHIKHTAEALIAAAVVHDLVRTRRAYRAAKQVAERNEFLDQLTDVLLDENMRLCADLETSANKVDYLVTKLIDNDVPADEFDLIVFNSLM